MHDDPTIATYDRVAGEFAARNFGITDLDGRCEAFARAIAGKVPAERFRILDAGCGPGRDSKWFHERGFQVIGVDLSAGMLAEARRRVPDVEFRQADLRQLDFPDGSFDGIWCCASLLHLPRADVPWVLASFRRLLDHGYLYLAVKAGHGDEVEERVYGPGNSRHFTYFNRHELELYLERAGFEVRQVWEGEPTPTARHGWLSILAQTDLRTPLLGATAIIFDDDGRVLVSERADGLGWNFPSGYVGADEAPDEAVVRETREETGIAVEPVRLVGVYTVSRRFKGVDRSVISHAFLCRPVGGSLTPTTESLQHGWFAPGALPTPMSSRHQATILQDALDMRAGALTVPALRRIGRH
jgi:SAM-dependent methyltransferase